MSETHVIEDDADFELQMKALANEAQQRFSGERRAQPNLAEMLKPFVLGIEALGRATAENTAAVARLEQAVAAQKDVPQVIASVHEHVEQKNKLNQRLFDSLHEELRSYKDGFLLEVFHRPIVRDLITLYDDLSALHRQCCAFLGEREGDISSAVRHVRNFATNLDHTLHSLIEILARMEVQRLDSSTGRVLDKKKQRAVSVEIAESQEEDQLIVASVKPGFIWRERLLRPEEVVIKKWKEGCLIALTPPSQK